MKTALIAFAICVVASLLTFLALDLLGVNSDIAKMLSLAVLGAFPKLRETLERIARESDPKSLTPQVIAFSNYEVHPGKAIAYVSIVGFAVALFAGAITGLLHAIAGLGWTDGNVVISAGILTALLLLPVLYLAGRWTGRRCGRHAYLAAITSGVLIRLAGTIFDTIVVPKEEYLDLFDQERTFGLLATQIAVGSALFSTILTIGVFVGRRQRLASYLSYLLTRLTPASRDTLVEIAYEEAVRIAREDDLRSAPKHADA